MRGSHPPSQLFFLFQSLFGFSAEPGFFGLGLLHFLTSSLLFDPGSIRLLLKLL